MVFRNHEMLDDRRTAAPFGDHALTDTVDASRSAGGRCAGPVPAGRFRHPAENSHRTGHAGIGAPAARPVASASRAAEHRKARPAMCASERTAPCPPKC